MWGYSSEEEDDMDDGYFRGGMRGRRAGQPTKNQSGTKLLELKDLRLACAELGLPATGTKAQLIEVLKIAKGSGIHIQAGVPSPDTFKAFFGIDRRVVPAPTHHSAPDVYEFGEDAVYEEERQRGYPKDIESDMERLKMALDNETTFSVQDSLDDTLTPAIVMKGKKKTSLSYPVPKAQFDILWKDGKDAPIGKGTETVFDAEERNCRYYAPSDFEITSKAWNTHFSNSKQSGLLEQLRTTLAPNTSVIESRLYKMVLYNSGSYFKSHLDTQRAEDMFGTLVVQISATTKILSWMGGTLHVSHMQPNGKTKVMEMERRAQQWMAFYADCVHSVDTLRDSNDFRIMLIYNLHRVGEPLNIPRLSEKDRYIAAFKAITQKHKGFVFGHLLEHQYGAISVVPRHLKGNDAVLFQALDQSPDFDVLLCPIQVEITANFGMGEEEGVWQDALGCEQSDIMLSATFPIDPLSPARSGFGVISNDALERSRVIMLEKSATKWSALAHASVIVTGNEGSSAALIYVHGALFVKYKDPSKPKIDTHESAALPGAAPTNPKAPKAKLTSHAKKAGEVYPSISESTAKQTAVNIPLVGAAANGGTKSIGLSDSLQQLRNSLLPQLEVYQTSLNAHQQLLNQMLNSDYQTLLQVLSERELVASDLKSLKATITNMKKYNLRETFAQLASPSRAPVVAKTVAASPISSPNAKKTATYTPTTSKSAKASVAATPTKALTAASPPKSVPTVVDLTESVITTSKPKAVSSAAAASPKATKWTAFVVPATPTDTRAQTTTSAKTTASAKKATATEAKTTAATPKKATTAKATSKATAPAKATTPTKATATAKATSTAKSTAKATAKATAKQTSPPASPPAKRTAKATKVTSTVGASPKATKAAKATSPAASKTTSATKTRVSKKRPASDPESDDEMAAPTPKKRAKRT